MDTCASGAPLDFESTTRPAIVIGSTFSCVCSWHNADDPATNGAAYKIRVTAILKNGDVMCIRPSPTEVGSLNVRRILSQRMMPMPKKFGPSEIIVSKPGWWLSWGHTRHRGGVRMICVSNWDLVA